MHRPLTHLPYVVPVAQDLHEHLAKAQEQLLCEQEAYAKIIQEEQALEADSGWLRQHIQGLLAEKRALQEEVERLKTYEGVDARGGSVYKGGCVCVGVACL